MLIYVHVGLTQMIVRRRVTAVHRAGLSTVTRVQMALRRCPRRKLSSNVLICALLNPDVFLSSGLGLVASCISAMDVVQSQPHSMKLSEAVHLRQVRDVSKFFSRRIASFPHKIAIPVLLYFFAKATLNIRHFV